MVYKNVAIYYLYCIYIYKDPSIILIYIIFKEDLELLHIVPSAEMLR